MTSDSQAAPTGDVHFDATVDKEASSKPSWREWAGRASGGEAYRFGDITRHVKHRLLGGRTGAGEDRSAAKEQGYTRDAPECDVRTFLEGEQASSSSESCRSRVSSIDSAHSSTRDPHGEFGAEIIAQQLVDCNVWFGRCGLDVELDGPSVEGHSDRRIVARRRTGTQLNGISLCKEPLRQTTLPGQPNVVKYSFECVVLEVKGKTFKTLSLGFMWKPEAVGNLPETSSVLPQALMVGGDLPRWHLDGRELGKVKNWRPRTEVAQGTVLRAELVVDRTEITVAIFQDGAKRTEKSLILDPTEQPWIFEGRPVAVIDICGSVRKVCLMQSR